VKVAVLVPLYERTKHLDRLAKNLAETTPRATLYLRVVPGVTPEFEHTLNMKTVPSQTTRYPEGINELARIARADGFKYVFIGADDLEFHPGWWREAQHVIDRTGAEVVGTNDLCNPRVIAGQHATHFLVKASYLDRGTLDKPDELMSEAYRHSFVDDEIKLTAMARDTYAHADLAVVEHLHPFNGKSEWDDTYERGSGGDNFDVDKATYKERLAILKTKYEEGTV
jgi:hypothetical protein